MQITENLILIGLSALGVIYFRHSWIQGLDNNSIRPQYLFLFSLCYVNFCLGLCIIGDGGSSPGPRFSLVLSQSEEWGISLQDFQEGFIVFCWLLLGHVSNSSPVTVTRHVIFWLARLEFHVHLSHFLPVIDSQSLSGPQQPPTPGILPFCNALSLNVSGTCDLFLNNWLWQWWWTITSVLPVDSLYCLLGWHALMKQAAMLEKHAWEGSEGALWKGTFDPQSSRPQSTEFCWQPLSLEVHPSPGKLSDETPLWSTPWLQCCERDWGRRHRKARQQMCAVLSH